jgi:hypothetical protein
VVPGVILHFSNVAQPHAREAALAAEAAAMQAKDKRNKGAGMKNARFYRAFLLHPSFYTISPLLLDVVNLHETYPSGVVLTFDDRGVGAGIEVPEQDRRLTGVSRRKADGLDVGFLV